ncbi:MAG: hypothetical protein JSU64_04175 [candidate division WOR-3 bacterium]|nr:MAG: hypothetical protein JSU64_04175 [candidate division WOR-3 bacterium]
MPNLPWFILLFLCSHLPMLFLGFGLDPDAWRIANTAFDLRHHLVYHASRFPGYPVPEFLNALIIDFGYHATNSLTMLLSLLSALAFGRILREADNAEKGLLVLTYAFMPLVWINSTNTMDYMWSLSFIILTWLFITKERYVVAGLLLAMAAGSRAASAAFVIPFLYLIHSRGSARGPIARFVLTFLATSVFIYIPLLVTYGLSFIHRYPSHTGILQIGYQALKYCGLPSLILLAIILLAVVRNLNKVGAALDKVGIFSLLSITIVLVTFFLAPYQIEYLVPLVPFGLLLAQRLGRRFLFIILCCALMLHSFVNIGSIEYTDVGRVAIRALDAGAVIKNFAARRKQMAYARRLAKVELPKNSVAIVGTWLPIVAHLDERVSSSAKAKQMFDSNLPRADLWNFADTIHYRYLIDHDELRQLQQNGRLIFYIEGIRGFTRDIYGYDINEYGAILLDI